MGEFITVSIKESICLGLDACGSCISKCPVNIFVQAEALPTIDDENEDECTLCNLCLDVCAPDCIVINKEYE